jgi:hypothetical protein
MSKWEEWKESMGSTRPWHLLDHGKYLEDMSIADDRLKICKVCPELIRATTTCKKCGCFMTAKTKLEAAACPLKKW